MHESRHFFQPSASISPKVQKAATDTTSSQQLNNLGGGTPTAKKSHLEGAGDRGGLVHRVHSEERRHAQAVQIVAGLLQPGEDEVALPVVRGPGGDRSSVASHAGRGEGAALNVALLRIRYSTT